MGYAILRTQKLKSPVAVQRSLKHAMREQDTPNADPAKTPDNDRWIRYSYTRKAKILSAEIDPDHQIWLDKDFFNNSYTASTHSRASLKLANYWAVFLQLVSHLASWIV